MSATGNKDPNFKNENNTLKSQVKELETKLTEGKVELEKSNSVISHLECLCSELQNQNKVLKDESITQIENAEHQGKELASEVTTSKECMQQVNSSLDKITHESKQAKVENEGLSQKLDQMKVEQESTEEALRAELEEKCDEVVKYRTDIAQVRLQNALDKERLFGEMQQLATTLVQSREQMKVAKETELHLRLMLQNYDQKFDGLQKALRETNTAYDGFKGEMAKVIERTKGLESETTEWKEKWEQSNVSLKAAEEDHTRLQTEIAKAYEGLTKMTNLCRALQNERKDLLEALKRDGE